MNDPSNHFFFGLFESPFHFESNATLQEVVQSLSHLKDDVDFYSVTHNDMTITPDGDAYRFCYRIRRRSKSNIYTAAFAEGYVWKAFNGAILVEGRAQFSRHFYISIAVFIVVAIGVGLAARSVFSFFPLMLAAMGAFIIFNSYRDRTLVIEHIQEAVANTHNVPESVRREKNKQNPNAGFNTNHTLKPDSVWNDAISEYDNTQ